jgi:hypothetical protein
MELSFFGASVDGKVADCGVEKRFTRLEEVEEVFFSGKLGNGRVADGRRRGDCTGLGDG